MFEKQLKKLTMWDIALTKLAVAALVLFVITIWPAAMTWVHNTNTWYFFTVGIIAAVIVWFRMLK